MAWLIFNLSAARFDAAPDALLPIVPILARVLHAKDVADAEILTDALGTLRRYAASAGERAILAYADAGILLRVTQLVSSPILAVKVRFAFVQRSHAEALHACTRGFAQKNARIVLEKICTGAHAESAVQLLASSGALACLRGTLSDVRHGVCRAGEIDPLHSDLLWWRISCRAQCLHQLVLLLFNLYEASQTAAACRLARWQAPASCTSRWRRSRTITVPSKTHLRWLFPTPLEDLRAF